MRPSRYEAIIKWMPLDAIDTYIIRLCNPAGAAEYIFIVDPKETSFHVPFNLSLGKTYAVSVKATQVSSHKHIATYKVMRCVTVTFRTGTL